MRLPEKFQKPRLTPYECMVAYTGLKQHFNTSSSYDWFKYRGNIRVPTPESFEASGRTPYMYAKLSRHEDPIGLMVANLVKNPGLWVGQMNTPEAQNCYLEWRGRQEALGHRFKQDLEALPRVLDDALEVPDGGHPFLLRALSGGYFGLDSFCLLQKELNFFPYWDSEIKEPVIWPEQKARALAYMPFLEIEQQRIHDMVVARFPETQCQ